MLINANRVDVWACDLVDEPGSLASKLEALARTGANLEFIIARRHHGKPGTGVVYVTPITGEAQINAAKAAGFAPAGAMVALRLDGPDEPGIAYKITDALARAKINVRGLSAARINSRAVLHLAFDSEADANKAADVISKA